MATDSLVSQELKTLHEGLSISQKERAASTVAGAPPANMFGPTGKPQERNELHDQLRQFADELKGLFDGADKSISAHPAQRNVCWDLDRPAARKAVRISHMIDHLVSDLQTLRKADVLIGKIWLTFWSVG